ncbi:hypothetical protein AMTRI_Chr05g71100 [Amborella trichopoda]|uniref:U-box domain-containing protein n=1 Tax=Amborella trichopoda TaxID=13333 RepID=W1P151_AMBTC|nr:hypothetical protein AMTR_s00042p00099450 [Amborella trichopoda]
MSTSTESISTQSLAQSQRSQQMSTEAIMTQSLAQALQPPSLQAQQTSLHVLMALTRLSQHNRDQLAQAHQAIPTLLSLSRPPNPPATSLLSLSVLFNLSLNPKLKPTLATPGLISLLNDTLLDEIEEETSRLSASLLCSLALHHKNKAMLGVEGTIQALVGSLDVPYRATQHALSALGELVLFHGNNTLAIEADAVPLLLGIVEREDGEELVGSALSVLNLLLRHSEGVAAVRRESGCIGVVVGAIRRRSMLSKESSCEILLRLFKERDEWILEAEEQGLSLLLTDLSIRGSAKAREKSMVLLEMVVELQARNGIGEASLVASDFSVDQSFEVDQLLSFQ